jgi:galactoside O-acetyltransferase
MSLLTKWYAKARKAHYKKISGNYNQIEGKLLLQQPLLIKGEGKISIGHNVQIGYESSPGFWSGYAYFDLRKGGTIRIGNDVIINNNVSLTADGASIEIGSNTVTGINLSIMTGDGHSILPENRHDGKYRCLPVTIGSTVFIGDNVTILKGVQIGNNSVIGANSLVNKDIPENSVAAGNPCRVLRKWTD